MISNRQPAFDVEKVLEETIIDDKPHFLVKWKGYSAVQSTWEPIDNLLDVLDLLHDWKLNNNPHSRVLVESDPSPKKKKTKKIKGKGHLEHDDKLQKKLDSRRQQELTISNLRKIAEQESVNLLSSDSSVVIEDTDTHIDFFPKKSKKKQIPLNSQVHLHKPKLRKSEKSTGKKKNKSEEQMNGFKVIGKITSDCVNKIICCFEWEGRKVCEVELTDGRKVNMRKEDLKKICPAKLCDYYEKMENL